MGYSSIPFMMLTVDKWQFCYCFSRYFHNRNKLNSDLFNSILITQVFAEVEIDYK